MSTAPAKFSGGGGGGGRTPVEPLCSERSIAKWTGAREREVRESVRVAPPTERECCCRRYRGSDRRADPARCLVRRERGVLYTTEGWLRPQPPPRVGRPLSLASGWFVKHVCVTVVACWMGLVLTCDGHDRSFSFASQAAEASARCLAMLAWHRRGRPRAYAAVTGG